MEAVTTPAGAFNGYHVAIVWRWFSDSGGAIGHSQDDDWFSSEARSWIKYTTQEGDYQEEGGLVEYHLALERVRVTLWRWNP
jgi:hypothetical protein